MKRDYDKVIRDHYQGVAKDVGLSPSSTMADERTRKLETDAIVSFVGWSLRRRKKVAGIIMDVGCGNGYTLQVLSQRYPRCRFIGVEMSDELRALASERFRGQKNVWIRKGDIRDAEFGGEARVDVVLSQRVLINLLDPVDQKLALENIINTVVAVRGRRPGGSLLFIEAFTSALARLNEARSEFDLSALPPAHHNLYLADDYFLDPRLRPVVAAGLASTNFLSTHYFVTRVLHPMMTRNKPFKRNSEFVRFFTEALQPAVGDYSPLRLCQFERGAG